MSLSWEMAGDDLERRQRARSTIIALVDAGYLYRFFINHNHGQLSVTEVSHQDVHNALVDHGEAVVA